MSTAPTAAPQTGRSRRWAPARRLPLGLAVLGLLGLLTATATAGGDSGRDSSALHLQRGGELYQAGRFDDAVVELRAAYEQNPLPRILCNLAQAYRKGSHPKAALENYQLCLHTDPKLSAGERAEFQGYVDQLEREQALRNPPLTASVASGPPPPLYRRPWFWGVIGGAVALAAIGVGVGVGVSRAQSGPTPPDGVPVVVF